MTPASQLSSPAILVTAALSYFWLAMVFGLGIGLRRLRPRRENHRPFVSALVAARNEEAVIGDCLAALARQDYPPDRWELILIDDNSTDRTAEIARSFSDKIPRLTLVPAGSPPPGIAPKKHALSRGIAVACGEIILCTDADCVPPSGWIRGMVEAFAPGVAAVAGCAPLIGSGLAAAVGRFDAFVNAVISAGSIGLKHPITVAGRNFGYRREAWLDEGGFGDTACGASGDDDLLLQRLSAAGGETAFCLDPATFVPSPAPTTLSAWLRMKRRHWSAGRRYNWGLLVTAGVLWLYLLSMLVGTALAAMGEAPVWMVAALWLAKVAADGWTLARGARLLQMRRWILSWLAAELVTPFLFVFVMPFSLVGKIKWKGRELRN